MMRYDSATESWSQTPPMSLVQQICDELDMAYRLWTYYHDHDGEHSPRRDRLDAHLTGLEKLQEAY